MERRATPSDAATDSEIRMNVRASLLTERAPDRSRARHFAHRVVRLAATAGLGLAALFASAGASADPGTVVLTSGEVIAGDIQQVVKGEYLIVKLPTGEVKAIAWAQIGSFNFGGSVQVGAPPAPQPPPPPVYAPAPQPPPTVYTPPPPPPAYAPPPAPPPPPPPEFQPAWMLGVRLGSMSAGGYLTGDADNGGVKLDEVVGPGWSIEGDLGYHFSPSWTLYGFWEHGQLGKRAVNESASRDPMTNALGLGINANTSPGGPVGFLFDIAAGYRWLQVPLLSRTADGGIGMNDHVVQGVMPLRLGLGLSIVPARKFRIDLLGNVSAGTFTRRSGGDCPDGCSLSDPEQGTYTFVGFTAGGRWDL